MTPGYVLRGWDGQRYAGSSAGASAVRWSEKLASCTPRTFRIRVSFSAGDGTIASSRRVPAGVAAYLKDNAAKLEQMRATVDDRGLDR